tara:strand:- start:89 stop:466 length:378 start_codon:yes stop_codon:yes gene_type:complete
MDNQTVQILGQILDTTWGKSSTACSPTMSIKGSLAGDTLTVSYTTIVHLASERNLRDQVKRFEEESVQLTNDFCKKCKNEFKSVSSSPLVLKQLNTNDSVELITASPFTPRRTAYYRRFTTYEVR